MRAPLHLLRGLAIVIFFPAINCGPNAPSPLPLTPLTPEGSVRFFSGIPERRSIVVQDVRAFADLWAEMHKNFSNVEPMPGIDFTTHVVVGFAMGERPSSGFAVHLSSARRQSDGILIRVVESVPAAGCALLPVITAPIDIASVPRTGGAIGFHVETITAGCQ